METLFFIWFLVTIFAVVGSGFWVLLGYFNDEYPAHIAHAQFGFAMLVSVVWPVAVVVYVLYGFYNTWKYRREIF